MKNFSSLHVQTEGPISMGYRGYSDGLDCAIVDIIDSNKAWDNISLFVPVSETKALKAAIAAFNAAYKREKELDQLEDLKIKIAGFEAAE
jgi:hypothetical protein